MNRILLWKVSRVLSCIAFILKKFGVGACWKAQTLADKLSSVPQSQWFKKQIFNVVMSSINTPIATPHPSKYSSNVRIFICDKSKSKKYDFWFYSSLIFFVARFDKKPLFRYSGCHRYDSSALTIVLGLAFPDASNYTASDYTFFRRLGEDWDYVDADSSHKRHNGSRAGEVRRRRWSCKYFLVQVSFSWIHFDFFQDNLYFMLLYLNVVHFISEGPLAPSLARASSALTSDWKIVRIAIDVIQVKEVAMISFLFLPPSPHHMFTVL